jgi:hypothetical protein
MSKTVSLAAICVGLLCSALCAGAYLSQHRPGENGDPTFWELAALGVMLIGLGVCGLVFKRGR